MAMTDSTGRHDHKKVAAILLAAGGSTRMRQPKLLLHWHGQPLVRWTARLALFTGCEPVLVVTGANAQEVQTALAGLPLIFTYNPDWQKGQSTSVKAGVKALPAGIDAALFFLGDQPHIPPRVPRELLRVFQQDDPAEAILIPTYQGKRANPVLLEKRVFEALARLSGDAGARALFSQFPVKQVPFEEPDLAFDVDSPEDYQKLLARPAPLFTD